MPPVETLFGNRRGFEPTPLDPAPGFFIASLLVGVLLVGIVLAGAIIVGVI